MKIIKEECWELKISGNHPHGEFPTRYYESEELARQVAREEAEVFLEEIRKNGIPHRRIEKGPRMEEFLEVLGSNGRDRYHVRVDSGTEMKQVGFGFSVWCTIDDDDPWVWSRKFSVKRQVVEWDIVEAIDLEPHQVRIVEYHNGGCAYIPIDDGQVVSKHSNRAEAKEFARDLIRKFLASIQKEWGSGEPGATFTDFGDRSWETRASVSYQVDGERYNRTFEIMLVEKTAEEEPYCHAGKDGECFWTYCPQQRDGEPLKSGRHCPLDCHRDEE